jgi:phosphohistidine phosphatase
VANNSDHRGKELLLVRHAKSNWDDPYLDDHDRPLNERGLRNAPEMGKRLQGWGICPDAWISSTALRAITTAEIMAEPIGFPQDQIQQTKDLYHASATELQEFIAGLDDQIDSVVYFGHNPGITSLVANLYGLPIDNVPTCGVVYLQFNENTWLATSSAPPARAYFDFPKNKSDEALKII